MTCVLFLPTCVGSPTTPENENDPTRKYYSRVDQTSPETKQSDTIDHTDTDTHTCAHVHTQLDYTRLHAGAHVSRRICERDGNEGETKCNGKKGQRNDQNSEPIERSHFSNDAFFFSPPYYLAFSIGFCTLRHHPCIESSCICLGFD